MKKTFPLSVFLFFSLSILGQDAVKLIEEGTELHDKGEYTEAIKKYEAAIKIDPKLGLAYYEMALSYYSLKEYDDAVKYASKAIKKADSERIAVSAHLIKGAALDDAGKTKTSIKAYERAVKQFPENYLLRYNLGFSHYNNKEFEKAEKYLHKSVQLNPNHLTSHLLLAYTTQRQGLTVQPLLAISTFLFLENHEYPTNITKRASQAFDTFQSLALGSVTREGENKINISIYLNEADEYSSTSLLLSMMQASKRIEADSANLSTNERLMVFMKDFADVLMESKKGKNSFWQVNYANFIKKLQEEELIETYTHVILLASQEQENIDWVNENKDKVELVKTIFNRHFKVE